MTAARLLPFFLTGLCLTLLPACGDTRPEGKLPELHAATGTVTRSGQPVSGGMIRLRPVATEPGSDNLVVSSKVNPDGTFELATTHALSQRKKPGAPAGDYTVTYYPPGENQGIEPVRVPVKFVIAAGENELKVEVGKR